MKRFESVIVLAVKIGLILGLISAVIHAHKYSYYESLRWAMMTGSLFVVYTSLKEKNIITKVIYLSIALLFNPVEKFVFSRATWHLIDFVVAGIIALTLIDDVKKFRKNS